MHCVTPPTPPRPRAARRLLCGPSPGRDPRRRLREEAKARYEKQKAIKERVLALMDEVPRATGMGIRGRGECERLVGSGSPPWRARARQDAVHMVAGGGSGPRGGGAQAAAALQQLTPQDEAALYRGDHLSVQLGGPGERGGHEFIALELAQARDVWRARLAELTFPGLKQRTLEHGAASHRR